MSRRHGSGAKRLRPALVVGGITLGILLLFVLQFALPYFLGPVGLLLVGVVDAGIFLEMRHRRTMRRRRRERDRLVRGLVDRRAAAPRTGPVTDAFVVAIALVVFVVGYCLEGIGLGADSWSPERNLGLVILGFIVAGAAYLIIVRYGWQWEYYGLAYELRSESEKYDTTEDH